MLSIVGKDFSTLTGEEVITAVFDKGSSVATVEVLIRDDLLSDEGTECFTAELHSELPQYMSCIQNNSTTICIEDTEIVVYTFQENEFFVYESTGHVSVKLNSSGPIPSDVNVNVDVIDSFGSASGE